jgi:hypothetical protein
LLGFFPGPTTSRIARDESILGCPLSSSFTLEADKRYTTGSGLDLHNRSALAAEMHDVYVYLAGLSIFTRKFFIPPTFSPRLHFHPAGVKNYGVKNYGMKNLDNKFYFLGSPRQKIYAGP